MPDKIALIGGSGIYNLKFIQNPVAVKVKTPYGEVKINKALIFGREVFFMTRHGKNHTVPPHMINYRANIAALKLLGVEKIIAAAAVGSLRKEMPPGSLAVIDQFIDHTKGRISTFYSGEDQPVVHTDFTEPYCPDLRNLLIGRCRANNYPFSDHGTYVTAEGPRFETPAEIRAIDIMGGDLVGMTNVPEVVLAREAGICYATVTMITNYAAGISPEKLTHEEVIDAMKEHGSKIDTLFHSCIENLPAETTCNCRDSGKHFRISGEIREE